MKKTTMKIALALVVLMVLQAVFAVTAFAAGSEPTVATTPQEARKAVVQVNLVYTDENNKEHQLFGESGYFINANYILTCDHGLRLTQSDIDLLSHEDIFGEYFKNNYKNRLSVQIVLQRDVFVTATITEARSEAYDFAVLKLNTSLNGTTILPLGRDDMIDVTDEISCLGFPSITTGWEASKLYTSDDVAVTNGTIAKFTEYQGTDVFFHSALVSEGSSGGPTIINKDGGVAVVGMLKGEAVEWDSSKEEYVKTGHAASLNIDSITEILDRFAIPYTPAGATSNNDVCNHQWGAAVVNNCVPTYTCSLCQQTKTDAAQHTFGEWTESKAAEVGVAGEEKRTCSACQFAETRATEALPKPAFNPIWIIIAVAAFVIIGAVVAIILVVVLSGKKKAAPMPAPAPMGRPVAPQQPPVTVGAAPRPVPPVAPQAPFAPASNEGAGETTVLNEGAGETTVLGGAQASSCTLIRVKTGEVITVAASEFVIGKEKRRVNYCIADNNSISRAHAKIVTRGNDHFAVDMNSTNFTYVNGTKLSSGQEHLLKNGDKIKLSDEEFEFKA